MITRRHAMKLTLGSFVAALPMGTRAVAAIPADVTAPAVDLLPDGEDPALPHTIKAWIYLLTDSPAYDRAVCATVVLSNDAGGPRCTLEDMLGNTVDSGLAPAEVMRFFASLARQPFGAR